MWNDLSYLSVYMCHFISVIHSFGMTLAAHHITLELDGSSVGVRLNPHKSVFKSIFA